MTIFKSPLLSEPYESRFWDYEIEEYPIYSQKECYPISTHKSLFVSDKFIGLAPTDWEIHQPNQIIPEVHSSFLDLGFSYNGGGNTGNCIYLSYKHSVFDSLEIKPEINDIVSFLILVRVPNVYGQSFNIALVAERLICENGLVVKDSTDFSVKVTHRLNVPNLLSIFQERLPKIVQLKKTLLDVFQASTRTRITLEDVNEILNEIHVADRAKEKIIETFQKNCMTGSSELTEGTLWGLYNTVTEYYNNNFRATKDVNSLDYYNKQLESLVYGTRSNIISKATEIVQQRVAATL